jgi:hypothetical protein
MNLEHLSFLPPIGRWSDGEIKELDDGEQQVLLYGIPLPHYEATADLADPFIPTLSSDMAAPTVTATICAEARNFEPEDWSTSISESPLPVVETHKWTALPPLEWMLAIPVTWGAVRFVGSFLDRLGAAAADGLVDWLKRTSRKAKEAERDRFVTIALELEDGRAVYGFVPFSADDDELVVVRRALETGGRLAEVAGAQNDGTTQSAHRIAYLFDGVDWHLAWFVTDSGVYRTRNFAENAPQPERFLGYPMLPDEAGDGEEGLH